MNYYQKAPQQVLEKQMSAPMPVILDKSVHSDDDKQIQWQI